MISFTAEQIELAKLMLGHIPGALPKALSNAINRAAEGARTEATKKTAERYYVQAGDIRDNIKLTKSKTTHLRSYVSVRGKVVPLSVFKVNPSRPVSYWDRPDVLKVAVARGGGFKSLPRAFTEIGRRTGNIQVLSRVGKKRYPIRIHYGPSVPQMVGNERIKEDITSRAMETLNTRLDHEINRILRGYGK